MEKTEKKQTYARQPLLLLVVVVVIHSFFSSPQTVCTGFQDWMPLLFQCLDSAFLEKNGTVGIGHLVSVFSVQPYFENHLPCWLIIWTKMRICRKFSYVCVWVMLFELWHCFCFCYYCGFLLETKMPIFFTIIMHYYLTIHNVQYLWWNTTTVNTRV